MRSAGRCLLVALLLAIGVGAAARSVFVQDYRLQQQVLQSQKYLAQARSVYQTWLSGRLGTAAARAQIARFQSPLLQSQRAAKSYAGAHETGWLTRNAEQQNAELGFFLSQVSRPAGQRDFTADLQQRWLTSLHLRRDWLQARQRRLPSLQAGAHGALREYYAWRQQIVNLEVAELALAEEMAESFRQRRSSAPNWTRRGLELHARAQEIAAPATMASAQAAVVDRFAALSRLCRSAVSYQLDPGTDAAANLQDDEESFQELANRSEQESLKALARCLTLK